MRRLLEGWNGNERGAGGFRAKISLNLIKLGIVVVVSACGRAVWAAMLQELPCFRRLFSVVRVETYRETLCWRLRRVLSATR
jgi:hypothetical protein